MAEWVTVPTKSIDDAFGKQTYDVIKQDLEHLREQAKKIEELLWSAAAHGQG